MALTQDLLVNKKVLSDILKTSERTLTDWGKEGLPVRESGSRGKQNSYYLPDVIEWVIARAATVGDKDSNEETSPLNAQLITEKIRKTRAEANTAELNYARKRQDLVSTERVVKEWAGILSTVKQNMLVVPDRVVTMIGSNTSPKEIKESIYKEIVAALRALAEEPSYDEYLEDLIDESTEEQEDKQANRTSK